MSQRKEVKKAGMDASQFRAAAHSAVEEIIQYYDTLPSRRVLSNVEPGYLRPLLPTSAPQKPEAWEAIQADIEAKIMPGLTHWQSPNFMAFFPAFNTYPSMLGEMYSAAFTAPAFNWLCSPAITELETVVLDWMAKAMGLPAGYLSTSEDGGGGVIQGSASEAVVTTMVAARERLLRRRVETEGLEDEARDKRIGELRAKLVTLGSDQAHSSTQKGARIAGTRYKSVKTELGENLAMTGRELKVALEDCKRDGLEPFYLTCTLGTTSTCAVDRFEEIRDVLKEWPDVWVHVDAAYAGAALICDEYQHMLKGIEAFDSFDMNMHKWLLVNFDANCLFVRHRSDLTDALSITPSYLRNGYSESGLVTDYRDWQIPLGRRFRSLKIWFVMRSYGLEGMQAFIRNHIKLGGLFHGLIKSRPDLFEVITPHAFALTVLHINPKQRPIHSGLAEEATANDFTPDAGGQEQVDTNALTKEIYELINSRGEIFITGTVVAGIYAIRVVSANPMAEEKYLRKAFDILVSTTEEVMGRPRTKGVEENGVAY